MDFITAKNSRFEASCDSGIACPPLKNSNINMPAEENPGKYSRTQWILFGVLSVVNLLAGLVYSIQAPFYPAEASSKGASSFEFGLVLGVYELTTFFAAPILGSYMERMGSFRTFHAGVALCGVMTILFGFLDKVDGHTLFVTSSFLIRIPQAIGATAVITSSLTIVTVEFQNAVSTTFAAIETAFGIGFCTGPTIGSAIFEIGGFIWPFAVLGGLLLISAPISALILHKNDLAKTTPHEDLESTKSGLISLLKIPAIHFSIFAIVSTAMSLGFLSTVLEPHLRQFNLDPLVTGLMFLLFGGVYAISAPIWGFICDRIKQPKYITLIGSICVFTAFLLIGPASFLPIQPTLWITSVGLVIFGLGLGANFVSCFLIALNDSRANGFPNDLSTHALISGVWRSSVALGCFIGPSVAGALYDAIGFRHESLVILGLQLILICTGVVFLTCFEKPNATAEELEPILNCVSTVRRTSSSSSSDSTNSSQHE